MKKKIWASAHIPLPEQGEGFSILSTLEGGKELQQRLNNTSAEVAELEALASDLCSLAIKEGGEIYQPGGSPAFQAVLSRKAKDMGVTLYYAHSVRESKEEKLPDGSVKKVAVFRHQGWIKIQP
jgi:hypothetical protein